MLLLDILLMASILPSALLMYFVYKNDRVEKEPARVLVKTFIMGIVSIVITLLVSFFIYPIESIFIEPTSVLYTFLRAFFMVALVEEGSKFITLKLSTWRDKNFNYTFDAIVYSVFVSLGFATLENILYVLLNGLGTAISRAVTAIPGHMTDGIFMGIYYGRAKMCERQNDKKGKWFNLMMSILVPMFLHGLYDYCLMRGTILGILVYGIILVFIYVMMFLMVDKYSNIDKSLHTVSANMQNDDTRNLINNNSMRQ